MDDRDVMRRSAVSAGLLVGSLFLVAVVGVLVARPVWNPYWVALTGGQTVEEAMQTLADARDRIQAAVESAGVDYPPAAVTFVAFKDERRLEIWARDELGAAPGPAPQWNRVGDRPILAASGQAGPKLREGDRQVPEGVYAVLGLNPNSAYHLSMKLDYPNADDLARAAADGRTEPGSNIFIHGRASSVGCLAMGDPVIEELFALVHDSGLSAVEVVIAPHDPRSRPLVRPAGAPAWTTERYAAIEAALASVWGTRDG